MRKIKLTKGKWALVDNKDFELVNNHIWHLTSSGYAHRWGKKKDGEKGKTIYMHKIFMNCPKHKFMDHINGNKLDNRRNNLRICNSTQNNRNRIKTIGSSIYKGVYWFKQTNKWRSQIYLKTKLIFIGLFKKEHHAAMAYDIWAKDLFGEFAHLNFKTF